jgi:hypothetical protein
MTLHSIDGKEFIGLRVTAFGKRQIVYDNANGQRKIIDIMTQTATEEQINTVLQQAITSPRVLPTLRASFAAHKIKLDDVP